MTTSYPFTAILGQEAMQTALLVSAVDPAIGGVLVRGQKGTAKSTAARSLAALLPEITVVTGCPFHCDPNLPNKLHPDCRDALAAGATLEQELIPTPFVDLPLSATEDRLVGTLHLERTLQSGQRQFQPGLLATAHRGILYVDEVNLLPDHLVDLLLDTAASGRNLVEREGIQFSHASRFILVGTMNPEEGELRPQFLDRFGLCVTINSLTEAPLRRAIVARRLAFDRDPDEFTARFLEEEKNLRLQVLSARRRLEQVHIPPEIIDRAVALASAAKVQGHRAELALVRSARALAALMDRDHVTGADLTEVAPLALAHRFTDTTVLSPEEIRRKVAELIDSEMGKDDSSLVQVSSSEETDVLQLLDNMDFPGSAAAGSMLFTYLKKKLMIASSAPTNTST